VGAVGPGERVVRGTVVLERGVERGHAWVRWGQVREWCGVQSC
jgi:hypothetical protein